MKILRMNDDVGSMDEKRRTVNNYCMHMTTHMTTIAILEYSPWWLNSSYIPRKYLN
jgi:hypothetical protein